LSNPERLTRWVAKIAPDLQADVTFGSVRLGWQGPIVLENVRVVPRDGAASPLSIARIEGSHGLVAMLTSMGDLGRLRFSGVEGNLVFDEQRQSNLVGLVRPLDPNQPPPRSTGPQRTPLRMRLETDDAVLRISGPWTAEAWRSEPIALRARLAAAAEGDHSEWTLEPVEVFTDARMEPGVAQGVLAYIAPVLAEATRTSGRFSLRLEGGRFPVGHPPGTSLAGSLAMHEVVLGPGPLVLNLFTKLPGRLPPPPQVRIADESLVRFRVENQRVWHEGLEFGLPLAKPGQRLDVESSGSVGLADGSLDVKLALPIPVDLPQDRPLLAALSGKTVSVGIVGQLGAPQVNFDGSIRTTAGQVATELVDRLRNRFSGGPPRQPDERPSPAPSGQPPKTPPSPRPGLFPSRTAPRPPASTDATVEVARDAIDAGSAAQPEAAAATAEDRKSDRVIPATGDPTADSVIDLVSGAIEEVARRRAERRAAVQDEPATEAPPRRLGGGLLRDRLLRRFQPGSSPPGP